MGAIDRRLQLIEVAGVTVRAARLEIGWSQRELSRRSGVAQSLICRLETGRCRDLRVGVLDRLFVALGVRYWLGIDPPVINRPQRDFVHALCSAQVCRRLIAAGWLVEREVEVGNERVRGWIDLLAYHPASGTLLVIEVKTELADLGAIERSIRWYEREAIRAARRLGWRSATVASALLVLESRANDERIQLSAAAFDVGFPGRAPELRSVIAGDAPTGGRRFLAMIDPRSRRANWLRATRSDGRRTASPYVDHIDAVRLLEPGRPTDQPRRSAGR